MKRHFRRATHSAVCLALLIASSATFAKAPPPPPLPTRLFAPPEGNGKAFNSDSGLRPTYVEQEFLLSGVANVYGHDAQRRLIVQKANRPYTTRVLVRYPRDPKAFSGVVVLDLLHPEAGAETLWPNVRNYVQDSGDAYIQVTLRREPNNPLLLPAQTAIDRILKFDPVRYAQLREFGDSGQNWDIISEVGRLVRSDVPENPLRNYRARQLFTGGFSGGGGVTLFYLNEGFPQNARMPDGSPIFDGYLLGEPSLYPRVNTAAGKEDDLAFTDPRQVLKPRDVPVIQLYSMDYTTGFGEGRYRPDSDAPDDRYRLWVVPGAYHTGRMATLTAGIALISQKPLNCPYPYSTVPLDHYFSLALDHLKGWSAGRSVPPHALPVSIGPDRKPVMDADGNPTGGVPVAAMLLPTASHPQNGTEIPCSILGAEVMFSPEKLRQRYGSREAFLGRMDQLTRHLIGERWLLPSQAQDVMEQARKVDFGQVSGK